MTLEEKIKRLEKQLKELKQKVKNRAKKTSKKSTSKKKISKKEKNIRPKRSLEKLISGYSLSCYKPLLTRDSIINNCSCWPDRGCGRCLLYRDSS